MQVGLDAVIHINVQSVNGIVAAVLFDKEPAVTITDGDILHPTISTARHRHTIVSLILLAAVVTPFVRGKLDGEVFDANGFAFCSYHAVCPIVAVDALVTAWFAKAFESFREIEYRLVSACAAQNVAVGQQDLLVDDMSSRVEAQSRLLFSVWYRHLTVLVPHAGEVVRWQRIGTF